MRYHENCHGVIAIRSESCFCGRGIEITYPFPLRYLLLKGQRDTAIVSKRFQWDSVTNSVRSGLPIISKLYQKASNKIDDSRGQKFSNTPAQGPVAKLYLF